MAKGRLVVGQVGQGDQQRGQAKSEQQNKSPKKSGMPSASRRRGFHTALLGIEHYQRRCHGGHTQRQLWVSDPVRGPETGPGQRAIQCDRRHVPPALPTQQQPQGQHRKELRCRVGHGHQHPLRALGRGGHQGAAQGGHAPAHAPRPVAQRLVDQEPGGDQGQQARQRRGPVERLQAPQPVEGRHQQRPADRPHGRRQIVRSGRVVANVHRRPGGQPQVAGQPGQGKLVQRRAPLGQVDGHLHVTVGIAGRDPVRVMQEGDGGQPGNDEQGQEDGESRNPAFSEKPGFSGQSLLAHKEPHLDQQRQRNAGRHHHRHVEPGRPRVRQGVGLVGVHVDLQAARQEPAGRRREVGDKHRPQRFQPTVCGRPHPPEAGQQGQRGQPQQGGQRPPR